jgi:predicted transcriptional regulator
MEKFETICAEESCKKSILRNQNAVVTSLVKKDDYYGRQSRRFVEDTFGGSLPKFLTAFIGGKKLSDRQAEELKKLIDENRG